MIAFIAIVPLLAGYALEKGTRRRRFPSPGTGPEHPAKVLVKVDADRIDLLTDIMKGFGHEGLEARMRARVTYYHQVGYYAMDVRESRRVRLELAPYYAETLTGSRWMFELESVEEIRRGMEGERVFSRERLVGVV